MERMSNWKYIGKKDVYTVVKLVKMKHPESRAWIEAVLYLGPMIDGERQPYVREKEEFLKKFVQL